MSWISIGMLLLAFAASQEVVESQAPASVWSTHIELSYVNTSGNTDTQAFAGRVELTGGSATSRFAFRSNALYGRSDGKENTNRFLVEGRWEGNLTDGLFFFLNATYLTDKFAGYDYRLFGGPGLGFRLISSERQELRGLTSVNYTHDKFRVPDKDSETYGNLDLALEYRWKVSSAVTFKNNSSYATSLKDSGHYFLNLETSIEVKASSFVSLGVSYGLAFQGRPPSDEYERLDATFFSSLIFDF